MKGGGDGGFEDEGDVGVALVDMPDGHDAQSVKM